MQITFRQGIIKAPANFLQLSGSAVNLVIAQPEYILVTVADELSTYLFSEKVSVNAAWIGPFVPGTNYWLYWDIHPLTGAKTYGHTLLAPAEGPTAPASPANDQHWFDTTTNNMKVWNETANRWVNKIRVFAAALQGGTVFSSVSASAPAFIGSQLSSVAPALLNAGFIVYDTEGKPLRKGSNKFFTTVDAAVTGVVSSSRVKVGNLLQEVEAAANMTAYTVVTFLDYDKIGPANENTPIDSLFGIIEEGVVTGQITSVVTSGILSSDSWNWTAAGINAPLYVRNGGVLSSSSAYAGQDAIATVVGKTSIHFGLPRISSNYVTDLTSRVAKNGDVMTGALVLSGDPAVALAAATKQYVDNTTVSLTGDTMTGALILSGEATLALQAVPKQQLDSALVNVAKLTNAQTWTAQQTFTELKEAVYTIVDTVAFEIDPANGSVQKVVLGASRTPKATNFEAGQSVILKIDDGASYTITWTDATLNPTWLGGSAPVLATTGYTVVVLWKDGDAMYGKHVGNAT